MSASPWIYTLCAHWNKHAHTQKQTRRSPWDSISVRSSADCKRRDGMEERRKQETGEPEHFAQKTADGLIGGGGETKKCPLTSQTLTKQKTQFYWNFCLVVSISQGMLKGKPKWSLTEPRTVSRQSNADLVGREQRVGGGDGGEGRGSERESVDWEADC